MSSVIPSRNDKCKGAMLATAIGDALGWPNEVRAKNRIKKPKISDTFIEWTRSCSKPRWHDEKINPGEYSDDTQMVLSVSRSIIAGNWEKFFAENELPFWLSYERGGGSALIRAARSCSDYKKQIWQSNFNQKYFDAGGNGVAMRILPHVIAASKKQTISELIVDVQKNALITHGHPRAFLGATCFAYALDYLLRKENVLEYGELVNALIMGQETWGAPQDPNIFTIWLNVAKSACNYEYDSEWKITVARMVKQLEFIRDSLKKGLMVDDFNILTELECFGNAYGAGDVAVLAAVYLASKYANNPSLGIRLPAFAFGSDTDTIASMTGGLLGMLNGTSWIPPEWRSVQDHDCLIQMAELLLADNRKEAAKAEISVAKTKDSSWINTPIGKMRMVNSRSVSNGSHGFIIIRKWQTALGQTLYTKEAQLFESNKQQQKDVQLPIQLTLYDNAELSQLESNVFARAKVDVPEVESPHRSIVSKKANLQFVLSSNDVARLLENPLFRGNISVKEILSIISAIIADKETSKDIAERLNVEITIVDLLLTFVIDKNRAKYS